MLGYELDHKGASSMLGCDCLVVVEFHALNAFSFLFSILLLISAASELLWCLLGDGLGETYRQEGRKGEIKEKKEL